MNGRTGTEQRTEINKHYTNRTQYKKDSKPREVWET